MYDIIIIGAGAAGMTAALNALRNNKKVLIIEREQIGGQIASSPKVENLPSIKEISGLDFSSNLYDQIEALGVETDFDEVASINKIDNTFIIKTTYSTYEAKACIIASGVKHRHLKALNDEALDGAGISYCAVCDGSFYKGEDVAVIGDANTALQYALLLSNTSPTVYLCCLFDHLFGDKILIDRVNKKENIKITYNINLEEYKMDENQNFNGLRFKNTQTLQEVTIDCKGVFVAIGQIPDNERYANLVDLNKGYIVTNENCETKTNGLYAIGDCRVKTLRQVSTAVNDGAIAAFFAINYLESLN